VFHYGDYIYEYQEDPLTAGGRQGEFREPVRRHLQRNLFDVTDYRLQYAQYKMDTDLQAAHATHPFFMSYDDHEVENNWVQELSEEGTPPEIFRLRRAAAFQAWYEHMPVRRRMLPTPGSIQAYRSARWGDLAELSFLDTRQYRTDQPCGDRWGATCAGITAPTAECSGASRRRG
jgi:alkaline phosphatase D